MPIRRKSAVSPSAGGGGEHLVEGWQDAPTEMNERTYHVAIVGPEGTGKTTLALTAAGPIGLLHADEKIQGIVQPFARGEHSTCAGVPKRIRIVSFGFVAESAEEEQVAHAARVLWDNTRARILGVPDWGGRSVVLDTEMEAWELCRLGFFGTLKPQGRVDNLYGPVNANYRGWMKALRKQARCNLITIHPVKDEYIDKVVNGKKESIRTGKQLRTGFKEIGTAANVIIRTSKSIVEGGVQFEATIEKGWMNGQAEGLTFTNDDARLSYILQEITGVPEEEWK